MSSRKATGKEKERIKGYDTVYGRFDKAVEARGGRLYIDGREYRVFNEKDPASCHGEKWALTSFLNAPASSGAHQTSEAPRGRREARDSFRAFGQILGV